MEEDLGFFTSVGDHADYMRRVDAAVERAKGNLMNDVLELGDRPSPQAQGNFAESHHAQTFNVDAVLNRMSDVRARVLKSNGYKSTDISLEEDGQSIREYSLKYYKSASESVNEQKRYDDMERLIPEEQVEEGRKYIKRQVAQDRAKGRINREINADELERIKKRLTGRIQKGKAESEPLSRKEAESKLKETRQGEKPEISPQYDGEVFLQESLRSGTIAAGITIGMAIAPRIIQEMRYWKNQGRIREGALERVFEGRGRLAAESGVKGSIATAITLSARAGHLGEAASGASPSFVGTMVHLTVEGGKDYLRYRNGELSGEWFADGMMRKSVAASSGAYGAAIGQVVVPIPILGSMIGAAAGSALANHGYGLLEDSVDAFYREDELRELASAYHDLSLAWGNLEERYELWLAHSKYYREQVNQYKRRQEDHDQTRMNLNQKLRDQLSDDE